MDGGWGFFWLFFLKNRNGSPQIFASPTFFATLEMVRGVIAVHALLVVTASSHTSATGNRGIVAVYCFRAVWLCPWRSAALRLLRMEGMGQPSSTWCFPDALEYNSLQPEEGQHWLCDSFSCHLCV